MSRNKFQAKVRQAVELFELNKFIELATNNKISISHYHGLLNSLFHQVKSSASTFALAAAHMPDRHWPAKEYLFHHAQEESSHWKWILDDLRETGYNGVCPDMAYPPAPTWAYIAYNHFIATTNPLGRLAIATVLEGIGAEIGGRHGRPVMNKLGLQPSQFSFFLGHADSDVIHAKDITTALDHCEITDPEYTEMALIASTAGALYASIYDHAATSTHFTVQP